MHPRAARFEPMLSNQALDAIPADGGKRRLFVRAEGTGAKLEGRARPKRTASRGSGVALGQTAEGTEQPSRP